ncbi:MAG: ATP-binding cassette domain-containing protein, partial [Proteobacteria bacterium]|nr:ATP-binding cassette domain-containing protein [Pseudomonadota bacterium]
DKCRPNKCNFECGLICPVNRQKKECVRIIDIEDTTVKKKIASIVEDACIGCGLCAKPVGGCPFGAVSIVNVPTELSNDIINRYGRNGFRLYRMPVLKQGKVLGFIGQNGIGKTTIVQILTGKIKPNFEDFDNTYSTDSIINKFKGSEMHKYMTKLYNNELKISVKPQHVESLISFVKSKGFDYTVKEYLNLRSLNKSRLDKIIEDLELSSILESKIIFLSGGELQRLLCAITLASDADVYIFDEPTNYLDVRQRLNIAKLIRELIDNDKYIAVIEHDLSILDFISDYICILYGVPGAYGIVSHPLSTSNGINIYFDGYIPGENMRFRQSEYSITLNTSENTDIVYDTSKIQYNGGKIVYPNYELHIESGNIPREGSINIIMG